MNAKFLKQMEVAGTQLSGQSVKFENRVYSRKVRQIGVRGDRLRGTVFRGTAYIEGKVILVEKDGNGWVVSDEPFMIVMDRG